MSNRAKIELGLNFIEKNLKKKITPIDVAKNSFVSLFYFHRLFRLTTGNSVQEYILKRKISEAVKEILIGNKKIIDIAYDYSFKNPETFSRTVKTFFKQTPSELKKINELQFFENFLKQDLPKVKKLNLEPEMILKKEIHLRGISYNTKFGIHQNQISLIWYNFVKENSLAEIEEREDDEKIFGLYHSFENNYFKILIGAKLKSNSKVKKNDIIIPVCKYAVFQIDGPHPEKISEAWSYLYLDWQNKKYKLLDKNSFDVKLNHLDSLTKLPVKIYLPIE